MKRFYQHATLLLVSLLILVVPSHAQNAISAGTVLEGLAFNKSDKKFPMVVRIGSVDNVNGNFTGDVSWPSLNSVHRIEGNLTPHTITFREVAQIKKGSAHLNCIYALVIEGDSLDGRWVEPGKDRGIVQLKIK